MRISDWSSDVCSSDLPFPFGRAARRQRTRCRRRRGLFLRLTAKEPAMNELKTIDATTAGTGPMVFTFGEPDSVIGARDLWSYFEIWHNSRWYETPLPMVSLGKAFNMLSHPRSAIGDRKSVVSGKRVSVRVSI